MQENYHEKEARIHIGSHENLSCMCIYVYVLHACMHVCVCVCVCVYLHIVYFCVVKIRRQTN